MLSFNYKYSFFWGLKKKMLKSVSADKSRCYT